MAFTSSAKLRPGVERIDTARFPDVENYAWGFYEGVIAEYPRHVPRTAGQVGVGVKTPIGDCSPSVTMSATNAFARLCVARFVLG